MTNVLQFPDARLPPTASDCADSADPTALVRDVLAHAKDGLLQVISVLELVVRQGREIAEQIGDPAKKAVVDADAAMVDIALHVARMMALEI